LIKFRRTKNCAIFGATRNMFSLSNRSRDVGYTT